MSDCTCQFYRKNCIICKPSNPQTIPNTFFEELVDAILSVPNEDEEYIVFHKAKAYDQITSIVLREQGKRLDKRTKLNDLVATRSRDTLHEL
jgi:hypothetical protein